MKSLDDCFGRKVRLTDERLAHILEHSEMRGMATDLERTLREPRLVRRSRSDPTARLFYEFQARTEVSSKWLCIVVKYSDDDAFVIPAYLTDKPKDGEDLWSTR